MSLDFFRKQLADTIRIKEALLEDQSAMEAILAIAQGCTKALQAGKKVLIAGNGGSAADAQHFAGELVSKFYFDRPALGSIALTTDTSIMTAIGNDYGYEKLFERQIQALGQPGDVFIGISTSGTSKNIVAALTEAKRMGLVCYGWAGAKEGPMDALCSVLLHVPSSSTPRIQECHGTAGHMICAYIEEQIFGHLAPAR
ncbi:MAG: phosphoheptose isomerase [Candidatus Lambdaproteobacteria bacterium RIFOXYD2_FULL_50_16]|uniref:Phosphoheptose isomerase n=1 Tax=Candidatus Lambdaproteobacteria bacterium RIFOXYD2_FULL_50_16 TaxID=1817772 RepID=A0A1F6G9S9_9PROT|nr:MAG: phosphoheptose isomerase [Candidatus Lambdaproteobacteria bacterium RIFOXYD2_FULL_50_16]